MLLVMMTLTNNCGDPEFTRLIQACKRIKLGMHEEQVRETMGAPAFIESSERNQRQFKMLTYRAPAIAAGSPYVVIDPQTNMVVEVMCDDTHHLLAPGRTN